MKIDRDMIARQYLAGNGIEIGPLQRPLNVPDSAKVQYIDRLPIEELRKHYPELKDHKLIEPDIIDNGEELSKIKDNTLDFVIACHFLEHCENPIKAIQNMLRVLRSDGILFIALPDKRYIRDKDRPVTSITHLELEHALGARWFRRVHFQEWVECENRKGAEARRRVTELLKMKYSIHYHVWTPIEMIELIVHLKKKRRLPFGVEIIYYNEEIKEVIIILKKTEGDFL